MLNIMYVVKLLNICVIQIIYVYLSTLFITHRTKNEEKYLAFKKTHRHYEY